MGMSDTQYELLKHLNKAKETNPNNSWVSIEECNKNTVKSLERLEYIEVDAPRISAVITNGGQAAYVEEKRERNGLRDVVSKPPISPVVVEAANSAVPIREVVIAQPEAAPPPHSKQPTSARITAPNVSTGRF